MRYESFVRQQICEVGKILWQLGFTPFNAGNIVVKIADDEYLATPTRVSKGTMTPDMILKINGNMEVLEKMAPYELTSEVKIHIKALKIREQYGAAATIHTHSPFCQIFSILNEPFMDQEGEFVGPKSVPVTPYEKPGSDELADSIVTAMEAGPHVIMGGHGPLVVGNSLDQALMFSEMIEHSAKIAYHLRLLKR